MARSRLEIRDLMSLAVIEGTSPFELLTTVYKWKYDHTLLRAKALVGAASGLILAIIIPIVQPSLKEPLNLPALIVILVSAALLAVFGTVMYLRARRVQIEFIGAQSLLAELIEVRPFLKLIRDDL